MIKVFVSSTFRDMDYERDLLHDEIIPEINEYCRPYGEQIQLCDLRWGIDTSGFNEIDSSKKVLSVCQDEIDVNLISYRFLEKDMAGYQTLMIY